MPKKALRNRTTPTLPPKQLAEFRQVRAEVELSRAAIVNRGRELALNHRVAEQLRAARIAKGLTASEIASRVGIDPANLSRIETGQANPTLSTISRVADAIGVQLIVNVIAK